MSFLLLNPAAGSEKARLFPATLAYPTRRPKDWPSRCGMARHLSARAKGLQE